LALAFHLIDHARYLHRPILVTCSQGVARSASLVMAYIMRTLKVDMRVAYEFVRRRAPGVMPDVGMVGRLVELESIF
ncbi:phosphatases II, partial [Gonapodya prolifera JEL478]